MNSMLAECNLGGDSGHLMSLAVGDILLDNLGKRLTRTELLALLAEQDIKPLARGSHQTAHEQVLAITNSWRHSVQRELLQPPIERAEATQLVEALDLDRIGLIAGTAGGGKSSVLEKTVASLESTGAEVLALREAARGEENLMLPIRAALKDSCSVGEVCGAMRDVFGEYQPEA